MKKTTGICLAVLLCMIISITVLADVHNKITEPDYKTDYYMIVESKAGGIDFYANPDLESAKLNEKMIPNGTALHIEGEVEDEGNKRTWGYIQYHGMNGFVPLDDCRPASSRQEAIDSELYLAGRDNVDYQADYDIAASKDMELYQGPGEKYGTVPGARDIKDGEKLHITQDAHLEDGGHWGVTSVEGKQGWVNLEEAEKPEEQKSRSSEKTAVSPTAVLTATDKPAATSTSKSAETQSASEELKQDAVSGFAVEMSPAVSQSAQKTGSASEKTENDSKTKEAVVKGAENSSGENKEASQEIEDSVEENKGAAKEAENSEQTSEADKNSNIVEKAQETSAQNVKVSGGIPTPFFWIAAIAIAAVAGIIIYHFKNR